MEYILKMWRIVFILLLISSAIRAEDYFLHVSFDVTRELFKEINAEFTKKYHLKTKIRQSHGGSGKQTSSVIHGMPADIVSLALPYHMDLLAEEGLVAKNWRELFPNNSSPFSTSIVFLVPKGNPKNIQDWQDLTNPGIKVITANPKTSGGAIWNYASAWVYANKKYNNDSALAIDFMKKLYHNVPVLDSTARGAAVTFLKRKIGDVLITWESEALSIIANLDPNYEIIYPSIAAKIDIPVATIIKTKKKNQELANLYINFLFSQEGQDIISKYYYHGYNSKIIRSSNLIDIEKYLNWREFKKEHFSENGIFEQIYQ